MVGCIVKFSTLLKIQSDNRILLFQHIAMDFQPDIHLNIMEMPSSGITLMSDQREKSRQDEN